MKSVKKPARLVGRARTTPAQDTLSRRFVSLDVVATELDVPWRAAFRLVRTGELRAICIAGSEWRVERTVLAAFAQEHPRQPHTQGHGGGAGGRSHVSGAISTRALSTAV